ncbi:hypothetical protein M2101_002178 [Parabacteroides sp. PM5-20]|uniref:copper resistance protein NlpE N-terminal domain-containing protein n=1 Tax=Parabacteroides sp. PM5-20 TaxID=2940527 RepID=UPI00247407B3|nr:copper resistance protein NlpE N-terminal domain-containing protein [Parabacteroides sp. PM5-20]MDH6535493.1 hypothetical protein [Parabacteroides sp. PM5-20]
MKKYVMGLLALVLLVACSNKQAKKEVPSMVEEETIVVSETPEKVVNMRDSLPIEEGKGAVIERRYNGLLPGADVPGIAYDLTLYFQQDSEDGVFNLKMTYLDAEDGQDKPFSTYGKRKIQRGIPGDEQAIVYKLFPNDGGKEIAFLLLEEGDLLLLNEEMARIDSDLNYTLKLVK